jgi:hypothetical protein
MEPSMDKTPALTIPTIREVVVEELWNNTVAKVPINKARKGLSVVDKTVSANPLPKCLIAELIPFIPTKNKYRNAMIEIELMRVL